MNRKIKYRVWDNENKSYNDPYSYAYYALTQDGGLDFYCHGDHMSEADPDVYFIEQYTGLKDKNGKEICEGDIVEALVNGVWETGRNSISFGKAKWKLEVIYNGIRFMDVFKIIGSKNNPDRIYYLFDKELSDLEVVGNIHENPELLEEEK